MEDNAAEDASPAAQTGNGTERLDVNAMIEELLAVQDDWPESQVVFAEEDIRSLCREARDVFLNQPCLLQLATPIKICGDIHGQYHDLLRLFDYGGHPPMSNYLFLGDYVDRGKMSLETICLLLCYKVKYPQNFFIMRGNHESASINRMYGFYDECKRRYSAKLWRTFTDCFNCLPVAAIVDDKIFCAHGGLSPELLDMEQINKIQRPTDVPDTGLLCDLLWSDPDRDIIGWGENDRGVSFTFGEDIVRDFLRVHGLDLICRAHQVVEDGYEFFAKRRLVTLFSAPNYCGEFDNAGAMMSVDDALMCSFQILQSTARQPKPTRRSAASNKILADATGVTDPAASSAGDALVSSPSPSDPETEAPDCEGKSAEVLGSVDDDIDERKNSNSGERHAQSCEKFGGTGSSPASSASATVGTWRESEEKREASSPSATLEVSCAGGSRVEDGNGGGAVVQSTANGGDAQEGGACRENLVPSPLSEALATKDLEEIDGVQALGSANKRSGNKGHNWGDEVSEEKEDPVVPARTRSSSEDVRRRWLDTAARGRSRSSSGVKARLPSAIAVDEVIPMSRKDNGGMDSGEGDGGQSQDEGIDLVDDHERGERARASVRLLPLGKSRGENTIGDDVEDAKSVSSPEDEVPERKRERNRETRKSSRKNRIEPVDSISTDENEERSTGGRRSKRMPRSSSERSLRTSPVKGAAFNDTNALGGRPTSGGRVSRSNDTVAARPEDSLSRAFSMIQVNGGRSSAGDGKREKDSKEAPRATVLVPNGSPPTTGGREEELDRSGGGGKVRAGRGLLRNIGTKKNGDKETKSSDVLAMGETKEEEKTLDSSDHIMRWDDMQPGGGRMNSMRSDTSSMVKSRKGLLKSVKKAWSKVTADHPAPLAIEKSLSKEERRRLEIQTEKERRNDWRTNSMGEQHIVRTVLRQEEEIVWV